MDQILNFGIGFFAILLTLGLAVFVHEFGHMFFALVRGVGVESFAIGMGPKITAWHWRGIEFSLRWFPVGGFVKLKGLVPEEEPVAAEAEKNVAEATGEKDLTESSYDDMFALRDKGLVTKLMVFGGGVFMNFVTAIFAAGLLLSLGTRVPLLQMRLEQVPAESALAQAGLQPGDAIVAVNGTPTPYYLDFAQMLTAYPETQSGILSRYNDLLASIFTGRYFTTLGDISHSPYDGLPDPGRLKPAPAIALTVERQGNAIELPLASMTLGDFAKLHSELIENIQRPPIVGGLQPRLPAEKAGMEVGDQVIAVGDAPISSFKQMADIVEKSSGKELEFKVQRGDQTLTLPITPRDNLLEPGIGMIGIIQGTPEERKIRELGVLKSFALAPVAVMDTFHSILQTNVQFFKNATGKDVRENLGGPISIAILTSKAASQGFSKSLEWFIMLNLLLLIFNLLPLPVLDGGFILISIIEAIIRRPIPPRILAPVYTVFVIFFIGLMVTISGLDIWNWFIAK
jgi:regulator of sigma E protease